MCHCRTPNAGGAFGDFAIGDVFESVVYWLTADRNTLDALSHACAATRRHLGHSPNFVDPVFVCHHGCHVRCYTPRKRLAVQGVKFEALWRLRERIHDVQGLSLNSCTFTDEELAALLPHCPNVSELSTCGCTRLTFACTAISRFPITSLNVCGCAAISDQAMKEISRCPLTTLQLSDCKAVTDKGLKELSRCPLTTLRLSWCGAITNKGLKELSRCPLTTLKVECCNAITDIGLGEISRCPLTSLDLSFLNGVTDEGLKEISRCPLTTLSLSWCSAITTSGLKELSRCPLTALSVASCSAITNEGLKEVSRCLPSLDLSKVRGNTDDDRLSSLAALFGGCAAFRFDLDV